jgi:multidrug efflux pump subunit AcrB
MTRRPVGAGDPDPEDLDAFDQLERNDETRLELVRSRAEKWTGGIGALTGVLATALIAKGQTDATKLPLGWRIATAILIGTAIALLIAATYQAYTAAYDKPGALKQIKEIPLEDLHDRLRKARTAAATEAQNTLRGAVRNTLAAIALLAAAVAITWFAPAQKSPSSSQRLCITSNNPTATSNSNTGASRPQLTLTPCQ